jgi:hypothetical protein
MSAIRSFRLDVGDRHGQPLDAFDVPVEGAAFFVNPLFALLPGSSLVGLREPWYQLVPRRLVTGPLRTPTYMPPPVRSDPLLTIVPDPTDPVRAINVTLYDLERVLYQGDYATVDVFGPILTYLLLVRIAAGHYRAEDGPFQLRVTPQRRGGDMQVFDLLPEGIPVVGVFPLPAARRSGPRTSFQPVTKHTYGERSLETLPPHRTEKPQLGGINRLIWSASTYTALTVSQPVSRSVEVGGFLVGQVYREPAVGQLLVDIQHVLAAENTDASMTLLRFTADSWSGLHRQLAGHLKGLRLLGWWHTHLFPATDSFGLSGLDETLQRLYFPNPWHFAALLNVSVEQGRVLRCYQPDADGVLVECAFDVVTEG